MDVVVLAVSGTRVAVVVMQGWRPRMLACLRARAACSPALWSWVPDVRAGEIELDARAGWHHTWWVRRSEWGPSSGFDYY